MDTDDPPEEKHVVIPLERLLREVPVERLLAFLEILKLRWSVSGGAKRNETGVYIVQARIHVQVFRDDGTVKTLRDYESGGNSTRDAIARVLSIFLQEEDFDYHQYIKGEGLEFGDEEDDGQKEEEAEAEGDATALG